MPYDIKTIRKDKYEISEWSGGTTTQLYIYPEDSLYSELNFIFRISSASVNIEESIFTHLQGINRKIMILDGKLTLKHEGHHSSRLGIFEQDSFSGEWTTKSYGKATDFNLMMNRGYNSDLNHIKIFSDQLRNIKIADGNDSYKKIADILYCAKGSISIELDEKIDLYEGDLLVFILDKGINIQSICITNSQKSESDIIRSRVYKSK